MRRTDVNAHQLRREEVRLRDERDGAHVVHRRTCEAEDRAVCLLDRSRARHFVAREGHRRKPYGNG
jgi:hypothetical protein